MIYSKTIEDFRSFLIKKIPRVPNNRDSLKSMELLSTNKLILSYVNWSKRLIEQKPRKISFFRKSMMGIPIEEFLKIKKNLGVFFEKVSIGENLNPYISKNAINKGIILNEASEKEKGNDLDKLLVISGLHHFHIGNTKNHRSKYLIFSHVLEEEFRIICITDHDVFKSGKNESKSIFTDCYRSYLNFLSGGRPLLLGCGVTPGYSIETFAFALECSLFIEKYDFNIQSIVKEAFLNSGIYLQLPSYPDVRWYFDHLTFGILEKKTNKFFPIFYGK